MIEFIAGFLVCDFIFGGTVVQEAPKTKAQLVMEAKEAKKEAREERKRARAHIKWLETATDEELRRHEEVRMMSYM